MTKDNNDIFKEIQKNQKYLASMENDLLKEVGFIKNFLRNLDRKVSRILEKVEELEVVMEVTEIMADDEDETENYETEWSPYEDGVDNDTYEEEENDDEENFN
jgi:DNA anti-recombination protein RmuC